MQAHYVIMITCMGVFTPLGILYARSYREYDPLKTYFPKYFYCPTWFHVSRLCRLVLPVRC